MPTSKIQNDSSSIDYLPGDGTATDVQTRLREIDFQLADKWDDFRFSSTNINPPGLGSDPDIDNTFGVFLFDPSQTEFIFVQMQMPHEWKEESLLYPHVHWMKSSSAGGNVYWQLEYRWAPIGGVMDGSWTTLASSTTNNTDNDTQYEHLTTSLGPIDSTGKIISDMIVMKLSRIGGDAADTYGADAMLLEFDVHYQVDSRGSVNPFTKT